MDKAGLIKKRKGYGMSFWLMLFASYAASAASRVIAEQGGTDAVSAWALVLIKAATVVGMLFSAVMYLRLRQQINKVVETV